MTLELVLKTANTIFFFSYAKVKNKCNVFGDKTENTKELGKKKKFYKSH